LFNYKLNLRLTKQATFFLFALTASKNHLFVFCFVQKFEKTDEIKLDEVAITLRDED